MRAILLPPRNERKPHGCSIRRSNSLKHTLHEAHEGKAFRISSAVFVFFGCRRGGRPLQQFNRHYANSVLLMTHNAMLAKRCGRTIEVVDGRITGFQARRSMDRATEQPMNAWTRKASASCKAAHCARQNALIRPF